MKTVSRATHPTARRLLRDVEFCRGMERRVEATFEIIDQLPRTTADIELLLSRTPHRLSHEVQYTVLNMLDSLPLRPVDVKRLLPAVMRLLYNTNSRAAFVWMKAGCLLGDGLLAAADKEERGAIVAELLKALRSAPSVHARHGAFHAIEHALNVASLTEGKTMLDAVYDAALSDRALSLRRSAFTLLRDGYWWGNKGVSGLHLYARKQGRKLRIDDYY